MNFCHRMSYRDLELRFIFVFVTHQFGIALVVVTHHIRINVVLKLHKFFILTHMSPFLVRFNEVTETPRWWESGAQSVTLSFRKSNRVVMKTSQVNLVDRGVVARVLTLPTRLEMEYLGV